MEPPIPSPRGPAPGLLPRLARIVALVGLASMSACRTLGPPLPPEPPPAEGWSEEGIASWYGHPFHGRTTASGERYDMEAMTAAHQSLPFGTVLHVANLDNGLTTRVRINDRGPFVGERILDLSRRAAREIEMIGPGTAPVRITVIESPAPVTCWRVQAGSFRSQSNARGLAQRLRDTGWEVEVARGDGGLYRVLAGPFDSREAARRSADRLEGQVVNC